MRGYLEFQNVNSKLQVRILEYYKHSLQSSHTDQSKEAIRELPPMLSALLTVDINRPLIARCAIFKIVDDSCTLGLLYCLKPLTLPPRYVITRAGYPCHGLFFIVRGLVRETGKRVQDSVVLTGQDYFGEDAMLSSDAATSSTAVAITYVNAMMLTRKDFERVIGPEEVETVRKKWLLRKQQTSVGQDEWSRLLQSFRFKSVCQAAGQRKCSANAVAKTASTLSGKLSSAMHEAGRCASSAPQIRRLASSHAVTQPSSRSEGGRDTTARATRFSRPQQRESKQEETQEEEVIFHPRRRHST